jgi:hypothetical protein
MMNFFLILGAYDRGTVNLGKTIFVSFKIYKKFKHVNIMWTHEQVKFRRKYDNLRVEKE